MFCVGGVSGSPGWRGLPEHRVAVRADVPAPVCLFKHGFQQTFLSDKDIAERQVIPCGGRERCGFDKLFE